jgi:hypothetical protein
VKIVVFRFFWSVEQENLKGREKFRSCDIKRLGKNSQKVRRSSTGHARI